MRVHILDDWFDTLRILPCFEKLAGHDVTVWNDHCEDEDELASRIHDADVLVLFRERTQITANLISKLPNLKLITQRSVYPHIDIDACTAAKVLVSSNMHAGTPSFAAAEHTWALILAAAKQIPQQMESLRAGNWQMGVGRTLHGRTIGLYGYGRIAKAVAGYARAFGMNVVWWGSGDGRERAKQAGETIANSREEFFSIPDVISIHVRLKPMTKGIITRNDFGHMRQDAIFVNTSRAGLIEEGALLDAIHDGRPQTAALDVFDVEPITWADDPLAAHPNVIATPHIGFVTEDELNLQFSDIFDQIVAFEKGAPIHIVNPLS